MTGNTDKLFAGKYRLMAEIARGGMADVFLAVTETTGVGPFQKLVVIKVLRHGVTQDDEDVVRMFLDEARLAARLSHPNVVQTNEVGQEGGRYYLVMEYLEGQSLERILRHPSARDRFTPSMRLHVLTGVLTGLQYAHDLRDYDGTPLGVVHRDVSPSNIFVTYEGHTKLVDFGIAKARDASHETRFGMLKGKTRYMAPEQLNPSLEIDSRADLYSVGVVLWEMLSGVRMWKGVPPVDVLRRLSQGDVPSLASVAPDVPEELQRICQRALSPTRDQRYPTAAALEADLQGYLETHAPRVTGRDIGRELQAMFATDRAKLQSAVESFLKAPGMSEERLPSIPIALEGTEASTSSFGRGPASLSHGAEGTLMSGTPAPGRHPALAEAPSSTSAISRPESVASEHGAVSVSGPTVGGWGALSRRLRERPLALGLTLAGAVAIVGASVGAGLGMRTTESHEAAAAKAPAASKESLAPEVPAHRSEVRGVTDTEVLCGMSAAFSGPSRELGNRMKLGIETAFAAINEQGGVGGRTLRLLALDDGYEGPRAGENMKELLESRGVFAVLGNVGTPTAQVAAPYATAHKTIFFGAFTGSKILRQEPPDRYVFNYRASYEEETAKMVHYLVEAKHVPPSSIVVFAQHDGYGDAGFEGVAKTLRKYGRADSDILRVNYERNTVDVDPAVNDVLRYNSMADRMSGASSTDFWLRPKHPVKAIVMVATYKAAAKFIQKIKDHSLSPTFLNVSFVGSNALLEELKEVGPGYSNGVIVTQVVPHYLSGGTGVIRYREALNRYHPDQQPDFVSLEGYAVGSLFAEGVRRAGRDLDTEKLVDAFEAIHDFDIGLGTVINYGLSEHQGSHKVWGTMIDAQGTFQSIDMD
jgi:serine/threonine protein kinase/ABC-type branched-subunit amino acid transport system substrate-binding protein